MTTSVDLFVVVTSKEIVVKAGGKEAAKRDQTRANKESGDRMTSGGHIGGPFKLTANPAFLETRSSYFDTLWAKQEATVSALQSTSDTEISVTLPDGSVKKGIAFKTSPYDIAKAISSVTSCLPCLLSLHYVPLNNSHLTSLR